MGLLDKFKDLVGIEDIDEDEYEEEVQAAKKTERRGTELAKSRNQSAFRSETRDNKVLSMQQPQQNKQAASRYSNAFKLVVIEPDSFDECPKLVDSLKARKPIIINLEKVESDTARKVFDFLSGATYALNGNVQKVAANIFVFAPENVDIKAGMEKTNFDFANMSKNAWR
ncbi:MAG: cell division protein SepF [Firmicutes bacterium]|nr:cell division protein SepF [Bacillota bacterium]MBQ1401069.1 cell division protein SepF [Bacillota bacterium]MBQ2678118.1 cell division protein SepF [Bacillota bacterium]MBR2511769.1 cell division protein SepF [Bacillota bacterium]MDO4859543.1 cell division protein SepF [Bacillota bacterium]